MSKARDIASAAPAPSTVSATELGYVDGVTSAIQTQLDAKTAKSTLTTTGDIYYASAANTPARLGIGSTDQVLKVTAGIPAWATPSASTKSYTLINTGGTSLSGSSTVISSLSGYNYLFVHLDSVTMNNTANFKFRMNADTGSNYYAANGDGVATAMDSVVTCGASSGIVTEHFIFIDATNSTGIKPFWFSAVTAAVSVSHGAGYYGGTSVISSFTAFPSSGTFSGGTIKIYGAN